MTRTILTTTGISLLQNTVRENDNKVLTDELMANYLRECPEDASAETNSLLKFNPELTNKDHIVLFHTDTSDARRCVNIIEKFLKKRGFDNVRLIELQLQEDEQHLETRGLRNLSNSLIDEIEKAQMSDHEVIINATTGFKAQVVYNTMIGMAYQVPVVYIYEKFKRLVTLNPIPLDWDTNFIFRCQWFFEWLDDQPRQYVDVEHKLQAFPDEPDRDRIRWFLTIPDKDNEIFLSSIGNALFRRFKVEVEEAEQSPLPEESQVENLDDKIHKSVLESKHNHPRNTITACKKIAQIPYVTDIIGRHFENTTLSRIKRFDEGTIQLLWADNNKATNLLVLTTAKSRPQTHRIANMIRNDLNIK